MKHFVWSCVSLPRFDLSPFQFKVLWCMPFLHFVLLSAPFRYPRIQSMSFSLICPNQQSCVIRFPALTQWLRCCYNNSLEVLFSKNLTYRCFSKNLTYRCNWQWLPVSKVLMLELMTFQDGLCALHQYSNLIIL